MKEVKEMSEIFIPQIITITDGHEHGVDLESYQFTKERRVKLIGEINAGTARSIVSQLDYLDGKGDDDIQLIINSPGGTVSDGMMIYDAIKHSIHCDVRTVATGMAASMGAFLLAAGTKGKRYAMPNAEVMIHQPLGGVQGQATDISRAADHIQNVKNRLATILAAECGKEVEDVLHDMERDHWLTSVEALKYGIIDGIIGKG